MGLSVLAEYALRGLESLADDDAVLYGLLEEEHRRQAETLMMVAASSVADASVLACEGTVVSNVTTEGYPGARFHAGCEFVDDIERLAVERAKRAFGARYANVQPHSGTSANEIVMFSLLSPGDVILGMDIGCGGHLTHGAQRSVTGRYFQGVAYGLDRDGRIDYEQVRNLALEHRPKLIVAGASCYPRLIDFRRFRSIADEAGALLMADISHIAGLVAAGEHPSPIDEAHFTTTSTYKQLFGPRGGLILIGKDFDRTAPGRKQSLSDLIQKGVFPYFQGTPHLSGIAAKARALALVDTPGFKALARRIVESAGVLAACLRDAGYHVLTGGSDNHMVVLDVAASGLTGVIAERALEECRIVVNKNRIPGDLKPPSVASGLRLGTNTLALRGLSAADMPRCAALFDRVLKGVRPRSEVDYDLCPARSSKRSWKSKKSAGSTRSLAFRPTPGDNRRRTGGSPCSPESRRVDRREAATETEPASSAGGSPEVSEGEAGDERRVALDRLAVRGYDSPALRRSEPVVTSGRREIEPADFEAVTNNDRLEISTRPRPPRRNPAMTLASGPKPLSLETRREFETQLLKARGSRGPAKRIPKRQGPGPWPLSFAQERLWFLEQLNPGTSVHHMPFPARLKGDFDLGVFQAVLDEIVARHESLRTSFVMRDGQPVQTVRDAAPLPIAFIDLRGLPEGEREAEMLRRLREDAERPFDLAAAPLRVTVVRSGDREYGLLVLMHHIVSDGWSVGRFFSEVVALYRAFSRGEASPLAPLPIQYADYAVWQRDRLQGDALTRHLTYWTSQLEGVAPLELPLDHARPPVQTHRGKTR